MAIEELYQKVETLARQLDLRDSLDVIWAYSRYLQDPAFAMPADIEVGDQLRTAAQPRAVLGEWTLEQIAREVVRHAHQEPGQGRTLRQWATLAEIAGALRDIEDAIRAQFEGAERIDLESLRFARRQFAWQQGFDWRHVIRYHMVFNTRELNRRARRVTGLSIDQIFRIGMAFLAVFSNQARVSRQVEIRIPGVTREDIDRFLAFASLPRDSLSDRLGAKHALNEGFAFRRSSLRDFPLIQTPDQGQDDLACPIPTLLVWRFTTGLVGRLTQVGRFRSAFGTSFEHYVGKVLQARVTNPAMSVLEEQMYLVGDELKHSVDCIVAQGGEAALFVECKTTRPSWTSKAGFTAVGAMEGNLEILARAVVQVYRTIAHYRDGRYPGLGFIETRRIYPAVVTLADWHLAGPGMSARFDAAVRTIMEAEGVPISWLDDMPYSIMSVAELETVAGVIDAVGVHSFMSGRLLDPARPRWGFDAWCTEHYADEVANLEPLFRDEYDSRFADVT